MLCDVKRKLPREIRFQDNDKNIYHASCVTNGEWATRVKLTAPPALTRP